MQIKKYIPIEGKGCLIGTLVIKDPLMRGSCVKLSVFKKGSHMWVSLPSKPYVSEGVTKYEWLLWFDTKEEQDAYSQEVLTHYQHYLDEKNGTPSPHVHPTKVTGTMQTSMDPCFVDQNDGLPF